MLRFFLLPLIALSLQVPIAGEAEEASEIAALQAAMDSLGQAFISEDVTAIKALVTPDHIAIGPTYDGPVLIDEQIALFERIALNEWVPTGRDITFLSDTVAMTTFGLSIDGAMDNEPLHSRAYVTEIWVMRDGKWLQQLSQETALEER
jgi:Domain of unknown function (DUF4440)